MRWIVWVTPTAAFAKQPKQIEELLMDDRLQVFVEVHQQRFDFGRNDG
jgi:hypothetical protein